MSFEVFFSVIFPFLSQDTHTFAHVSLLVRKLIEYAAGIGCTKRIYLTASATHNRAMAGVSVEQWRLAGAPESDEVLSAQQVRELLGAAFKPAGAQAEAPVKLVFQISSYDTRVGDRASKRKRDVYSSQSPLAVQPAPAAGLFVRSGKKSKVPGAVSQVPKRMPPGWSIGANGKHQATYISPEGAVFSWRQFQEHCVRQGILLLDEDEPEEEEPMAGDLPDLLDWLRASGFIAALQPGSLRLAALRARACLNIKYDRRT